MESWTLTWTKLNKLDKTNIDRLLDHLPGVYKLSYLADDGSYYVFYVGQSEDVKQRLLDHISESETNVCIRNYRSTKDCFFRYAKISKKHIRDATEKQMYKHYEPTCNAKEPEGKDDIKVNLN